MACWVLWQGTPCHQRARISCRGGQTPKHSGRRMDRMIVRENRTFPSVINTDGKTWIAVSRTHSSSVIVWEAIQEKWGDGFDSGHWWAKPELSRVVQQSHLDWSDAWGKEVTWGLFIKYVTSFWISTCDLVHTDQVKITALGNDTYLYSVQCPLIFSVIFYFVFVLLLKNAQYNALSGFYD